MTVQKFEALKHSLRQSKDGVVVSFVVHPSDMTPELLGLPVGSRIVIGWTEAAEDQNGPVVQSAELPTRAVTDHKAPVASGADDAGSKPAGVAKFKDRKFDALKPAMQAGIRCGDADFQAFLSSRYSRTVDKDIAAEIVRSACGLDSRSGLNTDDAALAKWHRIEGEYQSWKADHRVLERTR